MKEKWINKLINLLNESEDWFVSRFISYDGINRVFRLDNWQSFHYTLILSKEYCFIKWLVENNKIDFDFDKIYSKARFYVFGKNISDTDYIIMLLSIQDNPIEFLIDILK